MGTCSSKGDVLVGEPSTSKNVVVPAENVVSTSSTAQQKLKLRTEPDKEEISKPIGGVPQEVKEVADTALSNTVPSTGSSHIPDEVAPSPCKPSSGEGPLDSELENLLLQRRRNSSLGSPQVARSKECRAVRVFISSTFRDFALERDYLMRHALPQLRKIGEERGVTIVFVDLRWGVTSEESSSGAVVKLCLREIDACRPFFVGMLGERYGWHLDPNKAPGSDELLEQTMDIGEEHYPWVKAYRSRSVTELEILHGALLEPSSAPHATFFFREHSKFLENMKNEIAPEELAVYESESAYCKESQTKLKESIELFFPDRIHRYNHVKYMSEQLVKDLTKAIDSEFKIEEGANSEYFKVRMQHEAFAGSRKMGYVEPEGLFECLDSYVATNSNEGIAVIGQSGLGKSALLANWSWHHRHKNPKALVFVHYVGCTAESTDHYSMIRRLMGDIRERLLIEEPKTNGAPDLNENELVEQFPEFLAAAAARASSAGQYIVLVIDALDQFEDKGHAHSLFWLPKVPNVRLVCSIKQPSAAPPVPGGETQAGSEKEAGEEKEVSQGTMFQAALMANAKKLKASTVGDASSIADDTLKYWARKKWTTIPMHSLNEAEQRSVIVNYLATHAKKLDNEQIQMVLAAKASSNPLFLRTLLDEARLFGNFFMLTDHLKSLLEAETSVLLYSKVLERMSDECGCDLVRNTVAMVLCARDGMNDDELREALSMSTFTENSSGSEFQMIGDRDSLKFIQLLFALREQLCSMSGMMTFFHDAVKQAVHDFVGGAAVVRETHARLAKYFEWRAPTGDSRHVPVAQTKFLESPREGHVLDFPEEPVECSDDDEYSALEQRNKRSLREFPHHASLSGQFDALADYLSHLEVMSTLLEDETGKYELVRYWREIDENWQARAKQSSGSPSLRFPVEHEGQTTPRSVKRRTRSSVEDYLASVAEEASLEANFALHKASTTSLTSVNSEKSATPANTGKHPPSPVNLSDKSSHRKCMEEAAQLMNRIATVLALLGKYDKAVKIREKELSINTTLYGEVHFKVSISCSELAKVYEKVYADYDHSMALKTRAVNIDRELLGPDHEELAIGYDNLAFLHLKLGQYEKAKELYTESLRIKERTCGAEHRDIAQTLCSMGLMFEELGQYESALEWYQRGLKIREKAYGPAHPSVARSLVDLGVLLMKMKNQFPTALEKLLHGYEILRGTLGSDHADVAAAANNLGLIYVHLRDFGASLRYHLEAKQIQAMRLGEDHPSYAATCSNIASVCQELAHRSRDLKEEENYFQKAEEHYTSAITVYKMKLGLEHPDRATALHNMATLYLESGMRELERNAESNPSDGSSSEKMNGKCKRNLMLASKNFELAMEVRKKVLGIEHESTKDSMQCYKQCLRCIDTGAIPQQGAANDGEDDLIEQCVSDASKQHEVTTQVFNQLGLEQSAQIAIKSSTFQQILEIWSDCIEIDSPEMSDVQEAVETLMKNQTSSWNMKEQALELSITQIDDVFREILKANYV